MSPIHQRVIAVALIGAAFGAIVPLAVVPWCRWPAKRRVAICTGPAGAMSFGIMAFRFDDPVTIAAYCLLSTALVAASAIDIASHRLPREITYATLALGSPLLVVAAYTVGDSQRWRTALLGSMAALAFMLILHRLSAGALGDGDVRFSPLLGAYLGWLGLDEVIDGLLLSFVLGAVYGITLIICTDADRRTALPFGPFLSVGTVLAIALPVSVLARP